MRSSRAVVLASVVAAFLLIAPGLDASADPVQVREAGPGDAFLCCNGFYSFLFDGDAVLATTGRAGIFRSDHRGQHWQRSMLGFVAQNGVAPFSDALCQSPSQPGTVYALAGIGQAVTPFNGVFSSADFGRTWVRGGTVDTGFGFNICVVDATDPRTVYLSGIDANFDNRTWRSTDGGQTIEDLGANVPACALGGLVSVAPGALYLSSAFGCLAVSHDRGNTFDLVPTPPGFLGVATVRPDESALFATTIDPSFNVTGVFRSTDGGASYVAVTGLRLPFGFAVPLAYDPTDHARIYTLDFEPRVSRDGGLTFTGLAGSSDPRFLGVFDNISVDPTGALFISTIGGPFRSEDGGRTFRSIDDDFHASSVVDLAFDAAGRLLVPVQHTKVLYRATHGHAFEAIGTTPAIDVNGFDSDAAAVAASPSDANTIVLAMVANQGIYRTDNGGQSWTSAVVAGDPLGYSNARFAFATSSRVYLVKPSTLPGLYRSNDAGQSFARLSSTPFGAIAVDPTNPDVLYAGTYAATDGLFKSTDGGQTLSPLGQAGQFSALAIDRRNSNTIYAGERFGQVLRSQDGGQSFAPASTGLAGAGVHGIGQDSRGTLFVWLRGGGLFASHDGAATWRAVDTTEALNRSGVEAGRGSLVVDPKHPGRVYLGNPGVIEISTEGDVDDGN